jgi:hypothetical protein
LAAAKASGNPKIDEARQKAVAEIVDRADQRAANVIPIMRQIQPSGATSLRQIAEALNDHLAANVSRHHDNEICVVPRLCAQLVIR